MKNRLAVLVALAIFFSASSLALANGLNLNSLGSRALAMGGAFVGLADDFSTIFWNPAGLSHFKTQYFGFFGTDVIPSATYLLQVPTDEGILNLVDAKSERKNYLSGMAAYYYPVSESLVTGIGVYIPSGLGAAWNGENFINMQDYQLGYPPELNSPAYFWESRIGLITIAPAISYRINEMVSIGASLNVNYGTFSLKRWAGPVPIPGSAVSFDLGQYEDSLNGWGLGMTFGLLVKVNDMLSVGATVRTPSTIKFAGETTMPGIPSIIPGAPEKSDIKRNITWPWWIAAGVSFRPLEDLILTADLQWTQWSKIDVIETQFTDPFWSFFMIESGKDKTPLYWKDALQVRLGAEYLLFQNVAVRGGYYFDPAPAPERTLNILLPSYTFNAFTFGLGYYLDGLTIDLGFEYLLGNTREVPLAKVLYDPEWESAMPGIYDMKILVPNISISYKF